MKISVVTINYNNKTGLSKTLDSIINQSYKTFEFIVIDGGSEDGSKELLLQNSDVITYWVSEPDHGIYHAMNKGIMKAKGDYCIFMNSGDSFYDLNVLENVVPFLDGTDVIYGNTEYTDGKMRNSVDEPPYFSFFYVSSFSHQSTFIRTELLKKYLYDESLKIVADWKFFLQTLILNNGSFKAIDLKISLYDANGISSTNKILYEKEREQVLNSLFPQWMLTDYNNLVYGGTYDEKLYVEMKQSQFAAIFYTLNVCLIKFLSFFRKGPAWINKYPIKLKK